jgi:hypothetical protein
MARTILHLPEKETWLAASAAEAAAFETADEALAVLFELVLGEHEGTQPYTRSMRRG